MNAQGFRKLLEQTELKIINNDNIINDFEGNEIIDIMRNLSYAAKKQLLYNQEFIEKYQIAISIFRDIICSLPDEEKIRMLEIYQIENYFKCIIIKTFNNSTKLDLLLKEKSFTKDDKVSILESLDVETLIEFLANNKEFFNENDIHPYEIIQRLDTERQRDIVINLENINLTLNEKKEILAKLAVDVKYSIDITNFPEEYKTAINMPASSWCGQVILERNLEDYRGLDNFIRINPEEFTEEQRTKLIKLCDICPSLKVANTLGLYSLKYISTAQEYKEAEQWIASIIDSLNPEYSKAQKMAIIDNEIGKKISYSPDFHTEVFNHEDSRALWKIISSGYGVCNGIARVEQYILGRIGIESEIICSENHGFLKIKDIELPLANGEIVKGNTILDPTWNLTRHRFGGKPDNFCISYEQARKNDIDIEGKDHYCHKNDKELQDATLNLDEQSLRQLFTSVGLADKEGQFPINDFIVQSKLLDAFYANQPEHNINTQFLLLSKTYPEFATCQNSSVTILSDILLNNENLKFNRCVVNRVYNKTDKEKRTILYVYIDSNELGKKFYFADKNKEQFVELSQEEFTKQFECYEEDLKKNKRI